AAFQNGEIRGVNIAQMMRDLTSSTLKGWQDQKSQGQSQVQGQGQGNGTDLTQLSASFKIDRGQAQTTDLNLVGPMVRVTGAGTIDLGTRMIGFRVDPKLVMTTEGQGRTSDPVGFGIPIMISGPWASPKIYPEMQGILDNPDGAYAKLKQMGQGLFGAAGANLSNMNLGGLSGLLGGNQPGGNQPGNNTGGSGNNSGGTGSGNNPDQPGGNLGQALGNLIQQGLSSMGGNNGGFGGLGGVGGNGGVTPGRSGSRSLTSQQPQAQQPQA